MKTVLVVDDVAENLAMLNALLRGHYRVKVASSGQQALALAEKSVPDLILLDVMMPDIDGYEVCRRLKADAATSGIPVIFLTAKSNEADEQNGFDLGAVDYIAKPISPPLVLARIKAQMQLKEARDLLEARNREDKQRFELALAQQLEINAMRSTFVSMTSHEFRTPLTSILSSQDLLRHYHDRLDAGERLEILDNIAAAAKRMVAMLDQVLTIGRHDANRMEFAPAPMDLAAFCHQLKAEAEASHAANAPDRPPNRVELDIDIGEPAVVADEKLLRHILGNLLSNAIKYSPQTASASFRVRREAERLYFEVADRGIGIPAADLPRLFGNFHRASNVGDIPGTGLGLAIVKRAADSHGGRITVTSEAGCGTCFTVEIPQFATAG